jgi:HEAT repeat protein
MTWVNAEVALGKLKDEKAVKALIEALNDKNLAVKLRLSFAEKPVLV